MNHPASPEAHPPAARAGVCPLPMRIVLSYLILWAQRSSSQAQLPAGARSLGPTDYSQRGRCCHLYIGSTVVTCLEICWPLGFWFSGAAASRYPQPRAGRSATECEHGGGLSTLAATPIDAP